jgi:tetratricopeptide (TPR) repeat protein
MQILRNSSQRRRSGSLALAALSALPEVLALVAVLALPAVAAAQETAPAAVAGPQPVTAAERRGVELATQYMVGGAAAWWPELARRSWLRALGQEAAVAEIETRAGTPTGSHWTLQTVPADFAAHGAVFTVEFPSGADDTLLLDLVEEGGALKIDSLRVASESGGAAAGRRDRPGADASPAGGAGGAAEGGHGGRSWTRLVLAVLLAVLGGAAIAAAWIWLGRRRRPAKPAKPVTGRASYAVAPPEPIFGPLALGAGGVALLALAAVAGVGFVRGWVPAGGSVGDAAAGAAAAGPEHLQLRVLLPLRRALTAPVTPAAPQGNAAAPALADAGQADSSLDAMAAAAGKDAAAAEVALLWRAQHRIDRGDAVGAERMLGSLPPQSFPSQAAELLRARLALLRLQPVETGLAYERALAAGVAHEGVLIEAVQALYILGFEDTAKRYLNELGALGGRNAETYYDLADLALIHDQNVEAHKDFRIAWRLEPIARAELLSQSLSAFMLQDSDLRHMMSLGTFAEPMGTCAAISRRAISLPSGFKARLLGEELRLTAGTSEVWAPGACDLAPAGTPQDGANVWQEEREAAALARFPELRRLAGSPGALAQPVLRRQTEEAAAALAERQRWTELIQITESLSQPTAILPVRLTRLRAAALERTGRKPEARQLLVRLALGDKASQRADPGALYQLANLLEQQGEFDQAIKLVTKANSELPEPPGGERILQLALEKRLASSMEQLKSPHFIVSYPLSRGQAFGKEAMRILEAERERLQKWIPLPAGGGAPIEVRLLPYQDFALGYSQGGDVLGLYDGVVRVPLGTLRRFMPFAVSVMTHELAHAMIAQRTNDRAPHWFHEGLAQHVEMQEEGRANPIADYRATDRLLAFPLIEPALQSFSSAVWVSAAYDEALWTMNYIEARYGVDGIHRLMDGFRAGQTTKEALATAFGTPEARFDQDVWAWCTTQAPRAWRAEVVRYDGGEKKPKEF